MFVVVAVAILFVIVSGPTSAKVILLHDGDHGMIKAVSDVLENRRLSLDISLLRFDPNTIAEDLAVLRKEGYRLVIGPRFSSQAGVLLPLIEELDLYVISPTVTSSEILGKSWRFVTMSVPDHVQTRVITEQLSERGVESILLVVDDDNDPYVNQYITLFKLDFEGTVSAVIEVGRRDLSFERLLEESIDAYFLVTEGLTAGKITAFLIEQGIEKPVFCCDFSDDSQLRLFSHEVLERMTVFGSTMGETGDREGLYYTNTYNALLLAEHILEAFHNDLRRAFMEITGVTVQGLDGTFTMLESRYAWKESFDSVTEGGQR